MTLSWSPDLSSTKRGFYLVCLQVIPVSQEPCQGQSKACNINSKAKIRLIAQPEHEMEQCVLFLDHWESLDSY